ncbi:MAG: aromatic ring-hydroxylating dioxygenase subunit alpha [Xanthomonadales bacterium]|nr:aromatic ring-hydroxylating dioxygenase subunit alpha [Xanthomonadales bacterium]
MSNGTYRETLPASYFYDPAHYRGELQSIWYREWVCLGREEEWPQTGDFRRVRIGEEQVIVTRDGEGVLHAFHNTCRHRGSVLCQTDSGSFRNGHIVCPYHAWSYSLTGELQNAPRTTEADGIKPEDFPLYRVALQVWRGFVFVNLDSDPSPLEQAIGAEAANVAAWPLEDLRVVHRATHRLACNWKIFWENYLECYHCPGVHPDLCQLVPVYRTGWMDYRDAGLEPDPEHPHAMLKPGAVTWSADGTTGLPWFKGLGEKERETGMTFATFLPTLFLVAHVDYVRTVRVLPLGPEETELTVDWYLHRDVVDHPELDVDRLAAFASQVVSEDARACELNQQGIRCGRHERGVLLERENYVFEFEQWVRERL